MSRVPYFKSSVCQRGFFRCTTLANRVNCFLTSVFGNIIFEKGSELVMYKIRGHYVYLTKAQFDHIFDVTCGHEKPEWIVSSSIIGHEENIERDKRITKYLEKNFKKEYYKFDFSGEDAHDNIEDILGDYDALSDAIDLIIADEPDIEDILGLPRKNHITNVTIKIYEKSFLSWRFGRKYTGNSININIKSIDHVYGELTNFIVESKTFKIQFTTDNVTVTYK